MEADGGNAPGDSVARRALDNVLVMILLIAQLGVRATDDLVKVLGGQSLIRILLGYGRLYHFRFLFHDALSFSMQIWTHPCPGTIQLGEATPQKRRAESPVAQKAAAVGKNRLPAGP